MNPLGTEARSLRLLKRIPLVNALSSELWAKITPHVSFKSLETGETLFSAGKLSEQLYLIMDGELGLYLNRPEGTDDHFLQARVRGDTAGDFAVLNGGSHLVSAVAIKKCRIACFPRFAFELLVDIEPSILAHVYDTAADLSRSVMLASVYITLFGDLPTTTMEALLEGTRLRNLDPGEELFAQGEDPDGLHIVVSGRLSVESIGATGQRTQVSEVGANETIGEFALLSEGGRAGSVHATRQSAVALLDKQTFDEHVMSDSTMITSLARIIVKRQIEFAKSRHERKKDQNFVVVPLDSRMPLRRFTQTLKREFQRSFSPLVIDNHLFDTLYGKKGAAQTPTTDVFNTSIAAWMDDKENHFSHVAYIANNEWSPWTQRCVKRADRILLVANATDSSDTTLREVEIELEAVYANSHYRPRVELVLLHSADTAHPKGTDAWLRPRNIDAFHHIRIGDRKHNARLVRRLTGTARGLVFSGGGARGFAHLGVQKAIEEHEYDIDYIGGASMGGLLGGAMALGLKYADVYKLCGNFANAKALFDYTLPVSALMKSKKLTTFCHLVYKDVRIEDLWIPFFCVSSNMTDGKEVLHQRGYLWKAIRSTISLPGIFSPVPTMQGELLIDGAVLNTFPVNIMEEKLAGGSIIGVNTSQIDEVREFYNYGTSLSGWKLFFSRINPFSERLRAPKIAETLFRATDIKSIQQLNETKQNLDVLIEPEINHFPLLEFKSFEEISEIGYQEALNVLFSSSTNTADQTASTHQTS